MMDIASLGLEVGSMLGSGSFAHVYQCRDLRDGREYAIKMINKQVMGKSKLRSFHKEAEILANIEHKNIIKFHSFHETENYLLIKMELMRGGTLRRLIDERRTRVEGFRPDEIALLLRSLLEGIRYLHGLNIIHRDLKPGKYYHYKIDNIILADSSDVSSLKIVDFGLSAKLEHNPPNVKSQCGTLLYMAPEIFNKPSYTKSVDLWSVAVIAYQLFNRGAHPFYVPGMKVDDFKMRLKTSPFPELKDQPMAQNFMEKISKKEYEERYNVSQALKHPFITGNKDDQIPLSIHESYQGFDSTTDIIHILKMFMGIGTLVPHKRAPIDEMYRFRVRQFISSNEEVRVYSPSRRRMRDKNNELFNKMKQILRENKEIQGCSSSLKDYNESDSPTLKKHDTVFLSLFEKEKSLDLSRPKELTLARIRQPLGMKTFDKRKEFTYCFFDQSYEKKATSREERSFEESQCLSPTAMMDRQFQRELENQIEQNVSLAIMEMRKHRRYVKKEVKEEPSPRYERPKLVKKYSLGADVQREYVKPSTAGSNTSRNNIYNRRSMSPVRRQYSSRPPMTFSMTRPNSQRK